MDQEANTYITEENYPVIERQSVHQNEYFNDELNSKNNPESSAQFSSGNFEIPLKKIYFKIDFGSKE